MNIPRSINNVVEKCENLLADGYLEKSITLIFENRKNTDFENEIIALSRRNSELQNMTITNELDYSHIEIEKSRITVSLLIILSKIRKQPNTRLRRIFGLPALMLACLVVSSIFAVSLQADKGNLKNELDRLNDDLRSQVLEINAEYIAILSKKIDTIPAALIGIYDVSIYYGFESSQDKIGEIRFSKSSDHRYFNCSGKVGNMSLDDPPIHFESLIGTIVEDKIFFVYRNSPNGEHGIGRSGVTGGDYDEFVIEYTDFKGFDKNKDPKGRLKLTKRRK
jgi:hypothetical protein